MKCIFVSGNNKHAEKIKPFKYWKKIELQTADLIFPPYYLQYIDVELSYMKIWNS